MQAVFSQFLSQNEAKRRVVAAITDICKKRAARYFNSQGRYEVMDYELRSVMRKIYDEYKDAIHAEVAELEPEAWNHVALYVNHVRTFLDGDHPAVKRRALKG